MNGVKYIMRACSEALDQVSTNFWALSFLNQVLIVAVVGFLLGFLFELA